MKKDSRKVNREVSSALWQAEALLDATKNDSDQEYVQAMIKGAVERIEFALSQPGFWY